MTIGDVLKTTVSHPFITRINHIALMARPGEHHQARAFYAGLLGMTEVPLPDDLCGNSNLDLVWFVFNDVMIHVSFTDDYVPVPVGRHVCIEVENLGDLRARMEAAGCGIEEQVRLPDRERFFVSDPFGNYFEFMEFN
tara:strand:+ start:108 stop:521 length:414 start_codon:yes stop_codon:yes gene_type:complete